MSSYQVGHAGDGQDRPGRVVTLTDERLAHQIRIYAIHSIVMVGCTCGVDSRTAPGTEDHWQVYNGLGHLGEPFKPVDPSTGRRTFR